MVITEYMPRRLQHIGRLLRLALIAATIVLLVYFSREMQRLRAQEREYRQLSQAVTELEQMQRRGVQALKDGDVREGEQCLLTAIAWGTSDTAPYLLLADLYTEYRMYEEALAILEAYGRDNGEIAAKMEELEAMVAMLEQSVFIPQG